MYSVSINVYAPDPVLTVSPACVTATVQIADNSLEDASHVDCVLSAHPQ